MRAGEHNLIRKRLFNRRKIDSNGCWIWTGASTVGYGQIKIKNKVYFVHRVSYEEFIGLIKNRVLHKCNNRSCFNPEHLYDGTQDDNVQDAIKDKVGGAYLNRIKTHCLRGHEYTPENTYYYGGGRSCKECSRLAGKKYRDNKRNKLQQQKQRRKKNHHGHFDHRKRRFASQ